MQDDALSHLPDVKRRELERVVTILFDEFDDATKLATSDKKKAGRILKIILFGSYARGDWVEDLSSGYRSDYDLLIVVSGEQFTDLHRYWDKADEHLVREYAVTGHLRTPVNFIVHSLEEVNDQLVRGRPFFIDVVRDGIILYDAPGIDLSKPKARTPEEVKAEARGYFAQWMPNADRRLKLAKDAVDQGFDKEAAFLLHQAAEALYHCLLLTLTLYSPKSHRLSVLRSHAESLVPQLKNVWPDDTKPARQAFAKLQKAYVEARYSAEYAISSEMLTWLSERIALLRIEVTAVSEQATA